MGYGQESYLYALPSSARRDFAQAGKARSVQALNRTGTGQARSESRYCLDQVGYFLSPLDFLKECLTFFLFRAAFKRLVFFRLFIFFSMNKSLSYLVTKSLNRPAALEFSFLEAVPFLVPQKLMTA